MDESEHGPHLPPQPGKGALYSPDWVVIPCLRDKGMDDAKMHKCSNVKQQSDKCYSTNDDNLNIQITDDSKEGPYQDRPLLCPFRLSPLVTCS